MLQGLTGIHLVIILGIVLLLFGATKLPALAKGLGQSINVFKKEMGTDDGKKTGAASTDGTANAAPVQQPTAQYPSSNGVQEPVVNPGPSTQPNSDSRSL
ncbi:MULTISPECIES: twin-arginine translocase TatA/TatE family subunit [unclassified Curtobacterium]|uniref:twin-arginine translocase TatA/TatE family subunit n=1 Tax=unclassified Curtobacterium TaxID=257496 RepID=UPI000D8A4BDD|nr:MULTISPECIES: twin-arginine translocase TatA/TatE family subunit [unclassified Curtobacterium]PYY39110.1 twin-arginine translocase TatA/TatE family subunit [Curtobacterium sp. MCPF17_046]PYY48293.1 twin-arginine translocase TatA/TatE family subunit [Curtobacterium sp. MCBD17_023]WIB15969.1 twin-arginine translocase TatA/TatE family subunit [Curtobacterium sp. MCPF17_050]